jgi:hypothetical protein
MSLAHFSDKWAYWHITTLSQLKQDMLILSFKTLHQSDAFATLAYSIDRIKVIAGIAEGVRIIRSINRSTTELRRRWL